MWTGEPTRDGARTRAGARDSEPTAPPVRLSVPNRPEYTPAVRDAVADVARLAGFSEAELEYVTAVTGSLAAMLMDDSLEPPEGGLIDLACGPAGTGVRVVLHDDGPPFDPARGETAASLVHELLRDDSPDWVVFRNLGRGGKDVTAMLHLPGASPSEATEWRPDDQEASPIPGLLVLAGRPGFRLIDGAARAAPAPPRDGAETAVSGADLAIGLFQPAQAGAVSHCIYDAYHLTYFNEAMYHPGLIAELNDTGQMISAVAAAADGTVAGHAALVFGDADRSVADLALVVTRRAWRGHGIAKRLSARLIEEAEKRGLSGVYCDAVTLHPYTQRLAHSLGFAPCGFRLAAMPTAIRFFGIVDAPEHRGSAVVMFRPIGAAPRTPLDVPPRHRDMIARIYTWMGAAGRLDGAGGLRDSEALETEMGRQDDLLLSAAGIAIHKPGADLRERVHDELRRIKRDELRVVEARLDLQAAGAAVAVDVLESLGFVFAGLRPGWPGADWLLMQYFNGVLVDYDDMVLDSERAEELARYVRATDPDAA